VLGGAAEDAEEHRQPQLHGTLHRIRAAAGAQPDLQRLFGAGEDGDVLERPPAVRAVPGDLLAGVDGHQQVEFGGVQHVVVVLVLVEERKGDRRRAASRDQFDASGGEGRGGRELLEHPDRVVGRQVLDLRLQIVHRDLGGSGQDVTGHRGVRGR